MALSRWTYEGQPNNTTVSIANSSSNGDPALGTGTLVSASASAKYSTAHPIYGSTAVDITAAVGDTVALRTAAFASSVASCAFQCGIYLTAYPTVTFGLVQPRGAGNQFTMQLDTAGRFYLLDNTGSSAVTLLRTSALSLNTPYLYDAAWTIGATNANSAFKHRVKIVSTGATLDEQTSTAVNLNNAAASPALLTALQFGKPNSAGAIAGMTIDNVGVQDGATDYIATTSAPFAITGSFSPTSGSAPLSGTLTLSSSGGTGTTVTYVIAWGDGATQTATGASGATVNVGHTYSTSGTYGWSVNATIA